MAQGLIKSDRSRDGLAAVLLSNVGDLEETMYEMQYGLQETLDGIDNMVDGAQANNDETNAMLTDLEAILQSLNISRDSRLNRPNLLKQNFWTSRNMPTSAVIAEELTVPIEDATAAAASLTFTVTNASITSSYVLHGVKSSDTSVVSFSNVSATFASGSATITISARSGAHNAAVTVTVYLCTVAATNVVYGNASRISGQTYPYMKSIQSGDYPGDDSVDGIVTSVVALTGASIITEPDGESYDKAIQYAITANSAYGNTEWLMYYNPYFSRGYQQGATNIKNYGQVEEMTPGKTYTLSCWVKVVSGDGVWMRFGYGNSYTNNPYNDTTNHRSGISDIVKVDPNGNAWQRVSWSFEFNPSGNWYTETTSTSNGVTSVTRTYNWFKKVCFGVLRKYTATVQLCGFRLVEGGLFLPTKYDEIKAQVDALGDGVASTAEAGAVITEYGVSA